jgi:hypothetical protein
VLSYGPTLTGTSLSQALYDYGYGNMGIGVIAVPKDIPCSALMV